MCLLDHVIQWDEAQIQCRSNSHHQGNSHPLWNADGVAAVHLIEYAAQAAAVHGGLVARDAGQQAAAGFLAGVRQVTLARQRIDDIASALDIRAYRKMVGPQGLIYDFEVASAGERHCSGRLTVMHAA